jgi:hypothetical protein
MYKFCIRVLVDIKYDSISPSFLKMISSWLAFHIHQARLYLHL